MSPRVSHRAQRRSITATTATARQHEIAAHVAEPPPEATSHAGTSPRRSPLDAHGARARFTADSGAGRRRFILQNHPSVGAGGGPGSAGSIMKQRAIESLGALNANFSTGSPGLFHDRRFGAPISWFAPPAPVWDQSQGIAGALDAAKLSGHGLEATQMLGALHHYAAQYYPKYSIQIPTGIAARFGTPTLQFHGRPMLAYAPGSGGGPSSKGVGQTLYYDDNSWIGLDFMQAYRQTHNSAYLHNAEQLFPFMKTGQQAQGGMRWCTASPAHRIDTPATAASTEYALRLYQATHNGEYLHFAEKNLNFMNQHLRAPNGLYYDTTTWTTRAGRGTWSPTKKIYSYNQGTAVGSNLLYFEITKDKRYLENATRTANASVAYFQQPDPRGGDKLWHSPPSFNAIYFRNLLALDRIAPNPAYRRSLNDYLSAAWEHGRDPRTGLFTEGGIGHYGAAPGSYLDQAGMVQLYALADWPAADLSEVG